MLGLNEDDTDTKIDEKWIQKDLISRKNNSIKLILRLSEYQIENSKEEFPLRRIPISQQADKHLKGAHYNYIETALLLRASSETANKNLSLINSSSHCRYNI